MLAECRGPLLLLPILFALAGSAAPTEPVGGRLRAAGGQARGESDGRPSAPECGEQLIRAMSDEHGIPGLAVAVVQNGVVVFETTRGLRDVMSGAPVTRSTLFQLSSTAKLFTGVLAMRLVEKGRLDLDRPLTDYLDDAPEGWKALTLRRCLNHSGGLFEITRMEGAKSGSADAASALAAVYGNSPSPTPGKAFVYSNSGFMIVGSVIERVTGQSFEVAMREELFRPAGMTATGFWSASSDPPSGAATGYYPDDSGKLIPREFVFPRYLWAAGGLASTLEDLIRFNAALQQGKLIGKSAVEEMWRSVQLNDGSSKSYGLGWDTKTHAEGMFSAGHEGGMLTTLRTYPAQGLTVVVLTNGFEQRFNPDTFATALAAVWEPSIVGLAERPCNLDDLQQARF